MNFLFVLFQIGQQRPPSGKEAPKPRVIYGRRQYDNKQNVPSVGASKGQLGNYTQTYGTITASGLSTMQSKKW